jgi:hypothetical protein
MKRENYTAADNHEHPHPPGTRESLIIPTASVAIYRASPNKTGNWVVVESLLEEGPPAIYSTITNAYYRIRAEAHQLEIKRLGDGKTAQGRIRKLIESAKRGRGKQRKRPRPQFMDPPRQEYQEFRRDQFRREQAQQRPRETAYDEQFRFTRRSPMAEDYEAFRWLLLDQNTRLAEVASGVIIASFHRTEWGLVTDAMVYVPYCEDHYAKQMPIGSEADWKKWLRNIRER